MDFTLNDAKRLSESLLSAVNSNELFLEKSQNVTANWPSCLINPDDYIKLWDAAIACLMESSVVRENSHLILHAWHLTSMKPSNKQEDYLASLLFQFLEHGPPADRSALKDPILNRLYDIKDRFGREGLNFLMSKPGNHSWTDIATACKERYQCRM
ncbi:hypothetical protein QR680_007004 [Steinernema hermaphroditum]|uniref:Uncharacterized protein n=1 Tax=Steinernema hermaphroditum TaxID=289476 RepID=A0AA39LYB7_9BILA|nr:hypothetical protein QR680_007004 [Steinernema hermaphroditum]